jgi:prepilin-type N-terminal cleavage/methylation domain-containing protein
VRPIWPPSLNTLFKNPLPKRMFAGLNCEKMTRTSRGFSLIELAIVITIIGILLAGFLQFYSVLVQKQRYDLTKQRLREIRTALTVYAITHERLPCPASPSGATVPPAQDRGGAAPADDCAPDAKPPEDIIVDSSDPHSQDQDQQIWIGILPTRALRLDGDQGRDAWGDEFTYAVSRRLTLPQGMRGNPLPTGNISVVDENGRNALDQPDTGRYVVVSHGPTGAGAWTPQGGRKPCQKDTLDAANCNGGTIFVVAPFSTKPGKMFYDDIVIHDDPNSGGNLLDRIAICIAKMAFYLPSDPRADQDGCKGRTNVWEGVCLQSYAVASANVQLPVGPAVALMPPASVTQAGCACAAGYNTVLAGAWNDNTGVGGVNGIAAANGDYFYVSRTRLYVCVQ